jgi:hypothetical protein
MNALDSLNETFTLFDLPPLQTIEEERLDVFENQQTKLQKILENHRIQLCKHKEEISDTQNLLKSL